MKVLIIEDEYPAAQKLVRLLKEADNNIEIIGVLESVEGAINWFLDNPHPELIFMDVQLEDGLCFEIFENKELRTPVIFTTAFEEYSLKAFKVNSVDYLLKPIDLEELKKAIQKYRLIHKKEIYFNKIEALVDQLKPIAKERFLIKSGVHYRSVQVSEINCFFIKERCNFINVKEGRNYAIDFSLDKAEKVIDNKLFFRVNRNFIINFYAIIDIIAYSSKRLKIVIKDWPHKEEILVSRELVTDFKNWMNR
jgi:DNA-binding LytR/AlgR family response regulator